MFAGCVFAVILCPCDGFVPVVLAVFAGCVLTELVVCSLLHAVLVAC